MTRFLLWYVVGFAAVGSFAQFLRLDPGKHLVIHAAIYFGGFAALIACNIAYNAACHFLLPAPPALGVSWQSELVAPEDAEEYARQNPGLLTADQFVEWLQGGFEGHRLALPTVRRELAADRNSRPSEWAHFVRVLSDTTPPDPPGGERGQAPACAPSRQVTRASSERR